MSLVQEIHESRKARLQRIAAAAWKAPVKPVPVVVAPPPEPKRDPIADLLAILSKAPRQSTIPHIPYKKLYPQVQEIQRLVALYYGLSLRDMRSPAKFKNLPRVRQIAMYLSKELALILGVGKEPRPPSYPEIARHFARDHTTVLYGVAAIRSRIESDPKFAAEIGELRQIIAEARPA